MLRLRPFWLLRSSLVSFAAGLALTSGCGGASGTTAQPETPPAAVVSPESEAPEASGTAPDAGTPPPSEASPGAASESEQGEAAAPPPAAPDPYDLCQKMCDRLVERCSASLVEQCRANCDQWDAPRPGCESEVRAALECASTAEDLQCVNIVPSSCTRAFRRIEACESGKPLAPEANALEIPKSWQAFESAEDGFSVPMPPGVERTVEGSERRYTAVENGVSYAVRVRPAPAGKPKDITVAQEVLAPCIKGLKLTGLIERPERRSLEFRAACPDGSAASGLLLTASGKLYVLSVIAPRGTTAQRDGFVYNFALRPAR
ncbi:MAG: hypothetical protein DIU78_020695 [Pseudomonadota bacterium]|nr:MAG: hypothetical protein DIU78_03715 [Pseudomonadota bacterium]